MINGEEIPKDKFPEYEAEIRKMQAEQQFLEQERAVLREKRHYAELEKELAEKLKEQNREIEMHLRKMEPELKAFQEQLEIEMEQWREQAEQLRLEASEKGIFHMDSLRKYADSIGAQFRNFDHHFTFDSLMARDIYHKIEESIAKVEPKVQYFWDTIIARDLYNKIKEKKLDSMVFPRFDHEFDYRFEMPEIRHFEGPGIMFGPNLESRFLSELKSRGIYREGENAIELSDDDLIINGEKQSDEMLAQFKAIYEKATGIKWNKGSRLNIIINDTVKHNQEYRKI